MKHLLKINQTDLEMVEVWGEMKNGYTMLCGVMHIDCFSPEISGALRDGDGEVIINMTMDEY